MYSTNLWHPCSQMKDYETLKPLKVVKAYAENLYLEDGKVIIDAISSWWCKSLGHNHPKLKQCLIDQLEIFEHIILANTTNNTIESLSKKICQMTQMDKVFFASDGSCAVEIAIKMATHAREIRGQADKKQIIALKNGYHGETCAALSVSDLGLYKAPYKNLLFDCYFIDNLPYVTGQNDPLWNDASFHWQQIEKKLEPYKETANAVILEPIVQGAGGMRIYSQDFLSRLSKWCKENDVYLIADEIMTGVGRTGKMLACEYAKVKPDFVCLSKGLTGGILPLSAMLTHNSVYELFYDDYATQKAFMHSHTHSGNALACAVALGVFEVLEKESIFDYVNKTLQPLMFRNMQAIADETEQLCNIRSLGAIVAADIKFPKHSRHGYQVFQKAIQLGALLRPLGNTIYWAPPLNTCQETLEKLKNITQAALLA